LGKRREVDEFMGQMPEQFLSALRNISCARKDEAKLQEKNTIKIKKKL
jgi:hypothetical protein